MADPKDNSYDVVPYIDKPFHFTHPRHLETMATLFGMNPKPIGECRVLELGCAGGGNIIPMAVDLPDSRFLGIDLSEYQIGQGQEVIAELGVDNIQLRHANILDIDECWGQFDYIICHGIFSWVPGEVREKILKICRDNMAPQGVAFISYNTYPGWHNAKIIRDLMLHHVKHIDDPREKINQAKSVLAFMANSSNGNTATGRAYREELASMDKTSNNSHVFHEYLEQFNNPFYLHEFVSQAESHGLQYLSNANLKGTLPHLYPPEIRDAIAPLPLVEQEQYLDFIAGTRFRRSLLCHAEVTLNRSISDKQIANHYIGLTTIPEHPPVKINNDREVAFKVEGGSMTSGNRLFKATTMYLKEIFPDSVGFDKLYQTGMSRLGLSSEQAGNDPDASPDVLAGQILIGMFSGLFRLSLSPPRYVGKPGKCPTVGLLPRLQASRGDSATSQLHTPVKMGEVMRHVVRRLDGKHDRNDLVRGVREAVESGEIVVNAANGKKVQRVADSDIAAAVDKTLKQVTETGLLS